MKGPAYQEGCLQDCNAGLQCRTAIQDSQRFVRHVVKILDAHFRNICCYGSTPSAPERYATDPEAADPLRGVNPHPVFLLSKNKNNGTDEKENSTTSTPKKNLFHNKVLSELAVDGEWPCQVCHAPYMLLLSRSIFISLSDPERPDWTTHSALIPHSSNKDSKYGAKALMQKNEPTSIPQYSASFIAATKQLKAADIWSARAVVSLTSHSTIRPIRICTLYRNFLYQRRSYRFR
mmetsp:Transcript_26711/g.39781  ORF Transcript_26711/g.39781 Transcript_26711/m.39781 type:complete len:234 (+) Transcript_26711:229-930(+)